jgi:hypothetical protein
MLKNIFSLLFFFWFVSGSIAQSYLQSLNTISEFNTLSGLPLSDKYGQISAVKIVIDLKTNTLYFLNSSDFTFHHEFCEEILKSNVTLSYFNEINYANTPKRKYLLGNLNFISTSKKYFLELSPTDLMSQDLILNFFNQIKNAFYSPKDLYFLINTNRLKLISDSLETSIPIIQASDIYNDLQYQAISKNECNGIIRFIPNLDESHDLDPNDIIILNKTPLYLPRVAGVIITEFQTPLSHLTILGQNRKIPIMAYTHVFNDSTILSLESKAVNFVVQSDTFFINPIDYIKPKKLSSKKIQLKYDLSVDTLIAIGNLKRKSSKYVGNKAQNFRELYKLALKNDFKTPESAFSIPFYFYHQHINSGTSQKLIQKFLNTYQNIPSDSIKYWLKQIRKSILSSPLDPQLLMDVENMISKLGSHQRMRFRSSTNAEDAEGFSGAGLYSSKTGILYDTEKPIDMAIKKVWASLWNYHAFMEREYFNIEHNNAYMGILVHRSFPSEHVNGVAITKNLYRYGNFGFVVNAQLGNENVVKPKSGVICDQIICYPNTLNNMYDEHHTIEIITTSNLNNGNLVMTPDEIHNLANQLNTIKKHFFYTPYRGGEYLHFGMDVEFKIDGDNRTLYLKQARPYND